MDPELAITLDVLPVPQTLTPSPSTIALLWWPKSRHFAFTHVKLAVCGTVWSCHEGRYVPYLPLVDVEANATSHIKGRGVFVFELPASEEEQVTLMTFLNQTPPVAAACNNFCCLYQTCIGGVSHALRSSTTSLRIWPVFPILVAAYLGLRVKVGSRRERHVRYVGPASALRNLCSWQVLLELFAVVVILALSTEALYFGLQAH